MNNEFTDMRNYLGRLTEGAVFSEDYAHADEDVKETILCSLYGHEISEEKQAIVKKSIRAYVFREKLRNNRDITFVVNTENNSTLCNKLPHRMCFFEVDFVETAKLEKYKKLAQLE